ncbi:MAG TPA: zinc-dependent alcohol dehydrogenase family protein [Pseudolabrys sp.]|nr:zinc-dependent alcohol dehydrogenase family protein [Pseudolabrys sp.]
MKIVQFERPGGIEVLDMVEAPMPVAGVGEVLVRAQYIGVGMPDVLIRSGRYGFMPPLPAVPGTEMSGTVEAVGAGVAKFTVGQRVLVSARERKHRGGCYAEYVAAPEAAMFAVPDGAGMQQAAALANYQVAFHLLYDCAQTKPGQWVLVYAAAGGVGSAILDLGRALGLRMIAVCSGAEKARVAREMGAEVVIDRATQDIAQAVRDATAGKMVDLILNPIGGAHITDNFALLAPFGLLVSYGRLSGYPSGDIPAALIKIGKAGALRTFSMHVFDDWPERRREGMHWLIERLGEGAIRPRIHGVLPLAEARRAHAMIEHGEIIGKLLLAPSDTMGASVEDASVEDASVEGTRVGAPASATSRSTTTQARTEETR